MSIGAFVDVRMILHKQTRHELQKHMTAMKNLFDLLGKSNKRISDLLRGTIMWNFQCVVVICEVVAANKQACLC